MITLKDVNVNNFEECLTLDVNDNQHAFVAPNLRSLAQAYVYREVARPFALYNADSMVGFAMLAVDCEEKEYWLWRFMIDKHHQNKGYGKEAMRAILAYFLSIGAKVVKLSFEPENQIAKKLYQSLGFYENGEMEEDEIVMQLDMPI